MRHLVKRVIPPFVISATGCFLFMLLIDATLGPVVGYDLSALGLTTPSIIVGMIVAHSNDDKDTDPPRQTL
jgi:hypothetical protein